MKRKMILLFAGVLVGTISAQTKAQPRKRTRSAAARFGPSNPFYRASALPFQAPPFNSIKDSDYQPALDAGMARHLREIRRIANNPAPPTFDNTLVAMEKSGQLYNRVLNVFNAVTQANTDSTLQKIQAYEAPRMAAHDDAIHLNARLFHRIDVLYKKRTSLHLDPESLRLLEYQHKEFLLAGAALSPAKKAELKKINQEDASLSNAFQQKLLAAANDSAYVTSDPAMLAGLPAGKMAAAALAAKERHIQGWVLPLQNTTQQPDLTYLKDRATRKALFEKSWNRAERGDKDDTRAIIARLAQIRARKAELLGFPNYAAWTLQDQMARTPQAAFDFLNALVGPATAKARSEAHDLQTLIDQQHGGFTLQPWDWRYYADQVREQRFHLDENQVKQYFELNNVLRNGVFYAAHQLYGITFKERHDIPVYNPDVRVFEVYDSNGKPLALWYGDYFQRSNKQGGAWMDVFVQPSTLLGTQPVVYNVCNFTKPAPGEPALLSFDDVTTMFHEFGHALHAMFSGTKYPTLAGTNVPRDFVEFPSQFNEHWARYPEVFNHYAHNWKTGEPMPADLAKRVKQAYKFNQGYKLTELLAAAELDLKWHTLPASAPLQNPDTFEEQALASTHLQLRDVPPRYRSSYFLHIWSLGYASGYYAYLWTEMLDDAAYQWFEDHGGLTRANGDRFRRMVLSRGNTEPLQQMYDRWLGGKPTVQPMLKDRGLD